ncbi:siderophore-iron reductase FhuF (plasmid) [Tistrella bauzanensis]|uniref:siderophore-iron reductase FhuF n=1 Tax=Tistrella TaxID=171436 RepID=UPI0031F63856
MTLPCLQPLLPWLTGDYAGYAGVFAVHGTVDRGPAVPLAEPAAIGAAVLGFAAPLGPARKVAAVSQWTKSYFGALILPAVAANLVLDVALPLDPQAMAMVLDGDGRPAGFDVAGDGLPLDAVARASDCGFVRHAALIDGHLAPMIAAFSAATGVPARMLWSNAADYLDRAARMLVPLARSLPGRQVAAEATAGLLSRADRPDGTPNLLHDPVRMVADLRTRKVCCLRYVMPGEAFCGSCPKRRRAEAVERDRMARLAGAAGA